MNVFYTTIIKLLIAYRSKDKKEKTNNIHDTYEMQEFVAIQFKKANEFGTWLPNNRTTKIEP